MRLQAGALEGGPAELEASALFALGNGPAQPVLDKGLQCGLFPMGQLACFFKKAVWYLYCYLHKINHIIIYGRLSRGDNAAYALLLIPR